MSTQTTCLYPCADGPLRGELHERGDRFYFDGRLAGMQSGYYNLSNGQYRWQLDNGRASDRK